MRIFMEKQLLAKKAIEAKKNANQNIINCSQNSIKIIELLLFAV
jgi:hypothetical protein